VPIDLMGHTHHGRPGMLALRPAPLQLHRLGYPGSLGAERSGSTHERVSRGCGDRAPAPPAQCGPAALVGVDTDFEAIASVRDLRLQRLERPACAKAPLAAGHTSSSCSQVFVIARGLAGKPITSKDIS